MSPQPAGIQYFHTMWCGHLANFSFLLEKFANTNSKAAYDGTWNAVILCFIDGKRITITQQAKCCMQIMEMGTFVI